MRRSCINRRHFMHYSAAGASLAVSSNAPAGPAASFPHRSEGTTDTCITSDADMLVVGSGHAKRYASRHN